VGGPGGVWVLCKRAPATLYPHHSVGVLAAMLNAAWSSLRDDASLRLPWKRDYVYRQAYIVNYIYWKAIRCWTKYFPLPYTISGVSFIPAYSPPFIVTVLNRGSRFELQAAAALLGHKAFILGRLTFAAFRIEPPEPSFHHHGAVPWMHPGAPHVTSKN
jgi:hypothetical protein